MFFLPLLDVDFSGRREGIKADHKETQIVLSQHILSHLVLSMFIISRKGELL